MARSAPSRHPFCPPLMLSVPIFIFGSLWCCFLGSVVEVVVLVGVCVLLVGAEAVGMVVGVVGVLLVSAVVAFVGVGEYGCEWVEG